MTNSPSPLPSPTPSGDRPWWLKWMRLVFLSGGVLLLLVIVGTLVARAFVYRRLGPIVETSIGNLIERPVEIGPITGFSLTSIQIDGAAIPPTAEDEDYAKVPRIDVSFNPIAVIVNLVRDRTLSITLTFSEPELYLQENKDGRWVELEIKRPEEGAPISLALETIKAKNATVIVAPFPQSPYALIDSKDSSIEEALAEQSDAVPISNPVTIRDIDVLAHLREENRYLDADITGVAGSGRFKLKSDVDFKARRVDAHLLSRNIQMTPFNDVVKAFAPFPATLQAGKVDTNLMVQYDKQSGLSCEGTAQVNGVEAIVDLAVPHVDLQPLSNVSSRLGCSGQTLTIRTASLDYGTLPIKASGSVNLDSGYDLIAQVPKLTLEQIQETVAVDLPVKTKGAVGATVVVSGSLTQPLLTGKVRNVNPIRVDKLILDQVSADFELTPTRLNITDLSVLPALGGTINGRGQVAFQDDGDLLLDADIRDVPTDAIASLYGLELPESLELGNFNSNINVFGDFSNVQAAVQWRLPNATYPGRGNVLYGNQALRVRNTSIQAPSGALEINANAFLDREEWDATVAVDRVDLLSLFTQLSLPESKDGATQNASIQGVLSSDIKLGGNFRQLTPEAIALNGNATLAGAEVAIGETPILDHGDWTTAFRWTGQDLVVEQFDAPGVVADGVISTNLQGAPTLDTLITQINLDVAVEPYDLHRIQAFIPANLRAQLEQQVAPRIAAPVYPQGQAQFQGTLTGTLTQPQLEGMAQLHNFSVASFQFAPSLSGPINFALGKGGSMNLTGGDDRIYARLNERYLPSDFEIREGTFLAQGGLSGDRAGGDRLTASIQSLNISRFGIQPLARADLSPVRGIMNLNLAANLANLSNPQVEGKVAIAQPGLGNVVAEAFTGDLSYRDGIATLDNGYFCLGRDRSNQQDEPVSNANLDTGPDMVVSSVSPDISPSIGPYLASNDNHPKAKTAVLEQCKGKSQFQLATVVNIFDQSVEHSQLTIQDAQVQDILTTLRWFDVDDAIRWLDFNAANFTASSENNAADMTTEAVALPTAPLLLAPFLDRDPNIRRDQLGFFAQWLEQWDNRQQNNRDFVPDLQDLDGQFAGTLSLQGSVKTGFNLNFDITGDRWTWGPYRKETRFIASGSVSPNAVTLTPLAVAAGNARVIIDGQIGLAQFGTSQLTVENVPVRLVKQLTQQFVPNLENLPIDVAGRIQTEVTLQGTFLNPIVEGTVVVENPKLNQQPLEQMAVNFGYAQARLTADSTIVLQDQERLTFDADIPYALPFMAIQPSDNRIAININVRDQGLALMNLFTQNQATWEGGRGEVNMGIRGTLSAPQILGTLRLKDGQISSPLLSQPITGITGTSEFNVDRVIIDSLQAQLGSGNVEVQGELPLFSMVTASDEPISELLYALINKAVPPKTEPKNESQEGPEDKPDGLVINVNALPLNIQNLLRVTVEGELFVTGMAIAPIISGDIGIFQGRVNVAGLASRGGAQTEDSDGETIQVPNPFLERVRLDRLKVTLEDQLQIARRPLFDIETIGGLTVTGTLANPRVQGDIELASGWINLFATQFRLVRNEDHVARFRASRPLTDPILDVSMNAVVREVERSPVPPSSPFASPEVSDQSSIPTFGGLQSVIITARVDGSSQHLLAHLSNPNSPVPNPLILTSSPSRSERQIVALLGGEIFSALESGNTGAALASYVGSGFVAGVGDQLADALGLSELSLFPTTDVSGESRLPLTIGIEAGLDIIPRRLSFSILEILDGTTNPQYGLRYRLGDRWQVRGSSDLNQDNRAILEFRNDF